MNLQMTSMDLKKINMKFSVWTLLDRSNRNPTRKPKSYYRVRTASKKKIINSERNTVNAVTVIRRQWYW